MVTTNADKYLAEMKDEEEPWKLNPTFFPELKYARIGLAWPGRQRMLRNARYLSYLIALSFTLLAPVYAQSDNGKDTSTREQPASPSAAVDSTENKPDSDRTAETSEKAANGSGESGTAESGQTTGESQSPRTTLKGGVRGAALLTVDGLIGIESDAKMLQTNVLEIAKECTRKETAVMRGPNYIGNGIVIPALGGPNGMVQAGDLPARRDKLEAWLGSSEEVLNVLQNHMDALIVPENASDEMNNLWSGMRSTMQSAKGNIDTMKELLSQRKFDKKQVGRAALRIYDSMTALDKMRAQILAMVQPKKE